MKESSGDIFRMQRISEPTSGEVPFRVRLGAPRRPDVGRSRPGWAERLGVPAGPQSPDQQPMITVAMVRLIEAGGAGGLPNRWGSADTSTSRTLLSLRATMDRLRV